MSIASRFMRLLGLRSAGRPLVQMIPVMSKSVRRGSREVLAAYRYNGWFRAVVTTVADGVATPTWRAYKPVHGKGGDKALRDPRLKSSVKAVRTKAFKEHTANMELVEVPDHEILRLIERPSSEFSGRAMRKLSQIYADTAGETFWWLQRDTSGRIVGYLPLPPHAVMMTPTQGSPFYMVSYQLFTGQVPASEIVWFKDLDPEDPHGRGAGMGIALGDELDTSEAIGTATKSAMQRGGLPVAFVGVNNSSSSGDNDNDEAMEDLQKRFHEGFKGPENAGKIFFAPGDISVAEFRANFRELQLQELDKSLRDYVRQVFNVSPELMGDLSSSNRSTSEEAKYTLAEYALLPRLEFWRTEFMHRLVPLIDRDVIIEYDDPRPQSFERVHKIMTTQPIRAFSYNELREFAGFDPLPELEGVFPPEMPGAGAGPGGEPSKPASEPEAPPAEDDDEE